MDNHTVVQLEASQRAKYKRLLQAQKDRIDTYHGSGKISRIKTKHI